MGNAMQRRDSANVEEQTLADALYSRHDEIEKIAADYMNVERLFTLALVAVDKNSSLAKCSHLSVIRACYDAARLGLEMNGVEAALVPFKGVATCIPMYQGLVKLVYEEPTVQSVGASIIREGDVYHIEEGTNAHILHKPNLDDTERERKRGRIWYAVAHVRGYAKFDYMTHAEIDALRLRSPAVRAGMSSPWDTDYNEMGKARILKRLCKTLPKRPRLVAAIEHDNSVDTSIIDSTVLSAAATQRAASALGAGVAGALPPPGEKPVEELADSELKEAISRAFDVLEVPRGRRKEEGRIWLGREPASAHDARELLAALRENAADRERPRTDAPVTFVDDGDPPPAETGATP